MFHFSTYLIIQSIGWEKATYSEVVGREDKAVKKTEDGREDWESQDQKSLKKEGCMNGGLWPKCQWHEGEDEAVTV